jgi:glycogen operon protein
MADHGLLSYRVFWFEREGAGFKPPAAYPRLAATCVSTHDLPTLAGWWQGADIEERLSLGFADAPAAEEARTARRQEKHVALSALAREGLIASADAVDLSAPMETFVAAAFHAYIGRTSCLLDLVQADDLAKETVALNLPGTDQERPNWQRRVMLLADTLWQTELGRAVREKLEDRASTIP